MSENKNTETSVPSIVEENLKTNKSKENKYKLKPKKDKIIITAQQELQRKVNNTKKSIEHALKYKYTCSPFRTTMTFKPVGPRPLPEQHQTDAEKKQIAEDAKKALPSQRPLATGVFLDLTKIPEAELKAREKALVYAMGAVQSPEIIKPSLAMEILPVRNLGIQFSDSYTNFDKTSKTNWTDPEPNNKRPAAAMLITSLRHIADISSIMPRAGVGKLDGDKSVVRVNSEYPHHIWFRAINLLLAEVAQSDMRIIPFPVVQVDEGDSTEADFQRNPLTYKGILCTPKEYNLWVQTYQQAVATDGIIAGFAGASRVGYVVMTNRIVDEHEIVCEKVKKDNERKMKENVWREEQNKKMIEEALSNIDPSIDTSNEKIKEDIINDLPLKKIEEIYPLPPAIDMETRGITYQDDMKWTTQFVLRKDSGMHGLVIAGWNDLDFIDQDELASSYSIFR